MKTRFSASVTLMGTITAIQAEKGTFDHRNHESSQRNTNPKSIHVRRKI